MRQNHHENCGKEQHNKIIKNIRQYCTEEHLKLHRPEKLCFPFKVEQKDGVGRYLVATRDIQPMGEIDLMLNFSLFPGHVPLGVLDLPPSQTLKTDGTLSELILYDRTLAYGPKPHVPLVCLQCLKPTEGKRQYRQANEDSNKIETD